MPARGPPPSKTIRTRSTHWTKLDLSVEQRSWAANWRCACTGGPACRTLAHNGRAHCVIAPTPSVIRRHLRICGSCASNASRARQRTGMAPAPVAAGTPALLIPPPPPALPAGLTPAMLLPPPAPALPRTPRQTPRHLRSHGAPRPASRTRSVLPSSPPRVSAGTRKVPAAPKPLTRKKRVVRRLVLQPTAFSLGRFYYARELGLAVGPASNYETFCRFVGARRGEVRQFCVASDLRRVPGSNVRIADSCDARQDDLMNIYEELRDAIVHSGGPIYLCCNAGEVRSVSLFIRLLAAETGNDPTQILEHMRAHYSPRVLPDRPAVNLVFAPFAGLTVLGERRPVTS